MTGIPRRGRRSARVRVAVRSIEGLGLGEYRLHLACGHTVTVHAASWPLFIAWICKQCENPNARRSA